MSYGSSGSERIQFFNYIFRNVCFCCYRLTLISASRVQSVKGERKCLFFRCPELWSCNFPLHGSALIEFVAILKVWFEFLVMWSSSSSFTLALQGCSVVFIAYNSIFTSSSSSSANVRSPFYTSPLFSLGGTDDSSRWGSEFLTLAWRGSLASAINDGEIGKLQSRARRQAHSYESRDLHTLAHKSIASYTFLSVYRYEKWKMG